MTKGIALDILRNWTCEECTFDYSGGCKNCERGQALDVAIAALEENSQLRAENARLKKDIETDGDLISRATVIRLTKEMISAEEYGLIDLLDEVKNLSSASLTVKANWVGIDDEPQEDFECSHCGRIVYGITPGYVYKEFPYCPECGAKMEGEINETDSDN